MKYFTNENNQIFAYDDVQVAQGYGKDLTPITIEEVNKINKAKEDEIKATPEYKLQEANFYLKNTDWVETYKLRHDLGLELIPEESSKWVIINKREEYKVFLKNLEGGN